MAKKVTDKTFMRKDAVDLLECQKAKADRISKDSNLNPAALVPKGGLFSEIPLRAALNTPEFYGGVRVPNVRGHGDVVCQSDQLEEVLYQLRLNDERKIRDILIFAFGQEEASRFNISEMTDSEKRQFLDVYDQTLRPGDFITPHYELTYPPTRHTIEDGLHSHYFEGRRRLWND